MKKITKLLFILTLVAVLASSAFAIASASTDTVSTFNQLYIGEYDQDSETYTGMAHVVFGIVSNTETEFGILIETEDSKVFKFPGKIIADSGKFGVAIYQLPEGNYKAFAYSGTDDNRIVGEGVYFTANKATYTLTFDTSKTAGIATPATQTIAQGTVAEEPTVVLPDSAPANSDVTWLTADGKVFDFDAVLTADTTAYATWCADEKIAEKAWNITGLFGNSTLVDLSDGSSITMEFDVLDCNMGNANYNNYVWIVNSTTYTKWAGYYFGVYGNWALGGGYPAKYLTQNNLTGEGVETSLNCSPTTMYVKGKSTRITYTAPTANTTGSIICYNKAIGATEWTETWSATNLTLANVQDTSKVFMGIDWEGTHSLKVNNLRMYVNDGEYDLPCYSQNASNFTEYVPEYTVTFMNGKSVFTTESVLEGNTVSAPDISSLTAPLGGIYTWVDANGKEFDFDTPIEADTTIYTKAIADPQVKKNTYSINVTSSTSTLQLMTSVPVDLSAGDKLYVELDVTYSSLRNWHNCNVGFGFWQYLPEYGTTKGGINLSGFHDIVYYNNPIHWHQGNTGNYAGTYQHGDHAGANPTLSGEYNPAVIFADGKTVRMVYTAPTDTTNGSMLIYNKDIGADDSTYTLICSATDIVKASAVTTTSTYAGLNFYTFNSGISMTMTNYHVYTEAYGDIPALFDYNNDGTEFVKVVPEYTVTYMNGTSTFSTETLQEGSLATAPDTSALTAPLGGIYAWTDANGDVFDFETSIEANTTLYLKGIADPAVKSASYRLTAESISWSATLGTSVAMDLSAGDTATLEFDVLEGLPNANYDAGLYLWQYMPNPNADNGYFGGFHDNFFYGNSAYASTSPNYGGLWKTEDFGTSGYTFGEKFRPHEIFATGNSVKMVYTAPTADTTGSIIIYTKAIDAEDSAYVEQASIRNLTPAMVCATNTTYFGFVFRQSAGQGNNLDMTVTNWHIYTADGDVPAMYDYNQMVVTEIIDEEDDDEPAGSYAGEDTIGNTYAIGYTEEATKASGWFGNNSEIDLVGDEVLTMEFEVLAAGNKWQNANSGFVVCDIDPTTQSTSPQNFSSKVCLYGNWAFDTQTYENRTAHNNGPTGTVSGIWDPYTDVAAGDWIKVEYKAYTSDSSKGYLRVYTKNGSNGTYVMSCSIEDITNEIRDNVRLVWYVDSGNSGKNFTHTITNYRMYTSKGQTLTATDSWGGNHEVTVTVA